MEFFKPEYSITQDNYHILSSDEIKERTQKWEKICSDYKEYVTKNKEHFAKKMIEFICDNLLHDFSICDVRFYRKRKHNKTIFVIEIQFYDSYSDKTVLITYNDVKRIYSNINLFDYNDFGDYLYGELLFENDLFSHNFITIYDSEINIICKKILINEL